MTIPKLIPILALTAITTLAPTNKAEAWWGWRGGWHGWGWWRPAVAVGVPLTVAATRPYYYGYGPYYYGAPYCYGGAPYYYRRVAIPSPPVCRQSRLKGLAKATIVVRWTATLVR